MCFVGLGRNEEITSGYVIKLNTGLNLLNHPCVILIYLFLNSCVLIWMTES